MSSQGDRASAFTGIRITAQAYPRAQRLDTFSEVGSEATDAVKRALGITIPFKRNKDPKIFTTCILGFSLASSKLECPTEFVVGFSFLVQIGRAHV